MGIEQLLEKIYKFLAKEYKSIAGSATKDQVEDDLAEIRVDITESEMLSIELQKCISKLRRAATNKRMYVTSKKGEIMQTEAVRYIKGQFLKMIKTNEILHDAISELQELENELEDAYNVKTLLSTRRGELKLCMSDVKFIAAMRSTKNNRIVVQPTFQKGADDKSVDIGVFIDTDVKYPGGKT